MASDPKHSKVRGKEIVQSVAGMLRGGGHFDQRAVIQAVHKDGWLNALTGIGDPMKDKMHIANSALSYDLITQFDAEVIWRSDDMAAKLVEKIPDEMTRQGWDIVIQEDDPDQIDVETSSDRDAQNENEAVAVAKAKPTKANGKQDSALGDPKSKAIAEATMKWANDFDVTGKAKEALEYSRAYGGGGIFLGCDDGERDLTKPLNLDKIKTFRWMNVLTPLELFPRVWYGSPQAAKYGEVMIYRLQQLIYGGATENGYSEKVFATPEIHESRIIRVEGIRVSRRHLRERNGWGDSIFNRTLQAISDFQQSHHGIAVLISDFAQAVMKIQGLAELIAQNDQGAIQARAQMTDMARSIARCVVIDTEEEFKREGTPVSGLDKLVDKVDERLASTVDMPVSMLMGSSPGGLGGPAAGDTDQIWFYDRVKCLQTRKLEPILRRIIQCGFRSKDGPTRGVEPKNWSIRFRPLWQLSALDESQRRLNIAQADAVYVTNGMVSPEEVAATRFGGDEYDDGPIIIDAESRAAIQTMDPLDPRPGPVDGVKPPAPPPPPVTPGKGPGGKGPKGAGGGQSPASNPPRALGDGE